VDSIHLPESILKSLLHTLSEQSSVQEAILFGSRARGDHRNNSDIDLALVGQHIPLYVNGRIEDAIGLFKIDIVRLNELDNIELLANIKRDGITIYKSNH
jgi:predicted nucleotidyltransferase